MLTQELPNVAQGLKALGNFGSTNSHDARGIRYNLYNISVFGENPLPNRSAPKFARGVMSRTQSRVKFQSEILRGWDSTGGRNSHFPIDFWKAITTVQRYCTACDHCALENIAFLLRAEQSNTPDSNGKAMVAQELNNVDWTPLFRMETCDEMTNCFYNLLTDLIDSYLRLVTVKRLTTDKPWVTDQFRRFIRCRQMLGGVARRRGIDHTVTVSSGFQRRYSASVRSEARRTAG